MDVKHLKRLLSKRRRARGDWDQTLDNTNSMIEAQFEKTRFFMVIFQKKFSERISNKVGEFLTFLKPSSFYV